MNADNGILWEARDLDRYLGLCPRCRAPEWPLAEASWAPPTAEEPDDVKPALVIHLAQGYEPQQVGPETAWVWHAVPSWRQPGVGQGRHVKRLSKLLYKMGLLHPQSGPHRPEPVFSVAVEPGALVICCNPKWRGRDCRCAVRVDIGPLHALIDKQRDATFRSALEEIIAEGETAN